MKKYFRKIKWMIIAASVILTAFSACTGRTEETESTTGSETESLELSEKGAPFMPNEYEPYVIIKRSEPYVYRGESGLYIQSYEAVAADGVTTTFQCAASYNDTLNLNSDSVMVYVGNRERIDSAFPSWIGQNNNYTIDMMIALNRDNTDWTAKDPENSVKSIQTRKDGSLFRHGSSPDSTNFYMVPTKEWIDYVWELVEPCIEKYNPRMIALEEPEMWHASGYSQGFKEEWKEYYSEEWQDPVSSPEAGFKAQKLKTYLFERIIKIISERIKEKSPSTKVFIATHSTLNYNAWGITAGLNHYMALGAVDGIIGQTWSDTVYSSVHFEGNSVRKPFASAFLDYASYVDSAKSADFFALADPKADNPDFTWDTYEYLYQHTVTAALLQPEIHKFELFPWPDRSFTPAPLNYKTYQLNVFNALNDLAGQSVEVSAGTPGVAVALSDTLSWHFGRRNWSESSADSIYGLTLPLIAKGIPVKFKALELIKEKKDLDGVNVLILAYDCMKPMNEQYNIAISEWVKEGGVLLYISGEDMFTYSEGEWWLNKGGTPLNNLLGHLGLEKVRYGNKTEPSALSWTGDGKFSDIIHNCVYASTSFYGTFEGETNAIIKAGGAAVGIDEAAGKGRFIGLSIPSSYFSKSRENAEMMRGLVKYALSYTGYEYVEANLMSAKRGNYLTAYAIERDEKLTGSFIDIYDSNLSVLGEKTVKADNSALLLDISAVDREKTPVLAFTGGRLIGNPVQETDKTIFSLSSPSGAVVSSRLLAKRGLFPTNVTAKTGGKTVPVYFQWENATSSLLVKSKGSTETVTIEVTWGNTPRADDPEIEFMEITIPTNSKDLDKPYIVVNTAYVNDGLRFCDLEGYIIYKFDLKEFPGAEISVDVFQNYVLEISGDGKNFVQTHNYKDVHPEHLTDGSNQTVITYNPAEYDFISDIFYFKISNTDKTKGWGGSIRNITITYQLIQ